MADQSGDVASFGTEEQHLLSRLQLKVVQQRDHHVRGGDGLHAACGSLEEHHWAVVQEGDEVVVGEVLDVDGEHRVTDLRSHRQTGRQQPFEQVTHLLHTGPITLTPQKGAGCDRSNLKWG